MFCFVWFCLVNVIIPVSFRYHLHTSFDIAFDIALYIVLNIALHIILRFVCLVQVADRVDAAPVFRAFGVTDVSAFRKFLPGAVQLLKRESGDPRDRQVGCGEAGWKPALIGVLEQDKIEQRRMHPER